MAVVAAVVLARRVSGPLQPLPVAPVAVASADEEQSAGGPAADQEDAGEGNT